ncbi:fimbrial protein [Pantoea agglomerans]
MTIKKSVISAAIAMGLISTSVFANNTGTIDFSGSVANGSCQIPASQMTKIVDLGEITTAEINAASAGQSVKQQPLQFDVSLCPSNITDVAVQFDFTPDATNTQYITQTGDAEGVLFGITDANDALVANAGQVAADAAVSGGAATVNAKIQAYRIGTENAVGGSLASTATVTLISQ